MEKILISVVGPTAIGKTKFALTLAKYFGAEIISADSRQFFKELNIGTAVPSPEELNAVPHHFIQHKSIFEKHTVGDFEKEAISLLEELFKKNDYVIMVGGSGLYSDAVINGLDEFPEIDSGIREMLNNDLKEKGITHLQNQLKDLDGVYYSTMDIDNPHRLIRALEICLSTGRPFSSFLNRKTKVRSFVALTVGLNANREVIYDRINRRVDIMIKDGLLEEAKKVYGHRTLNALQTVGYKELFKYFDGEWDLDFAISEIKKNSRRFAKRQLTWYRKNDRIVWFEYDMDKDTLLKEIDKELALLVDG